jgi:hypothetical protein
MVVYQWPEVDLFLCPMISRRASNTCQVNVRVLHIPLHSKAKKPTQGVSNSHSLKQKRKGVYLSNHLNRKTAPLVPCYKRKKTKTKSSRCSLARPSPKGIAFSNIGMLGTHPLLPAPCLFRSPKINRHPARSLESPIAAAA